MFNASRRRRHATTRAGCGKRRHDRCVHCERMSKSKSPSSSTNSHGLDTRCTVLVLMLAMNVIGTARIDRWMMDVCALLRRDGGPQLGTATADPSAESTVVESVLLLANCASWTNRRTATTVHGEIKTSKTSRSIHVCVWICVCLHSFSRSFARSFAHPSRIEKPRDCKASRACALAQLDSLTPRRMFMFAAMFMFM